MPKRLILSQKILIIELMLRVGKTIIEVNGEESIKNSEEDGTICVNC